MRPIETQHTMESGGISASGLYGLSQEDEVHILEILRNTLYSDKILAVLREYSANAWDAHRMVGRGNVPIKVHVPTEAEPEFSVRDYGPGLSRNDVFTVYTRYGKSTKRDDNSSVGFLGIGCKSAFAYADSFTVTSWHGGVKSIYVAALDPTGRGSMNLLHEEPCGDETGIEVKVAVRPHDCWDFQYRAKSLFQFFSPLPEINIQLEKVHPGATILENGHVLASNGLEYDKRGWTAVMGCIPYRIDSGQVDAQGPVRKYMDALSGALYFGIGELQVSASRESLKYSDAVKKLLLEKVTAIVDEFVQGLLRDLAQKTGDPWSRRLRSQVFRDMGIPLPKGAGKMFDSSVDLGDFPPSFYLSSTANKEALRRIIVGTSARIIVRDEHKAIKGYSTLRNTDLMVRRSDSKAPLETIRKDLEKLLADHDLTGIPVVDISTLPWNKPFGSKSGDAPTYKAKQKLFRLKTVPGGYSLRRGRSSHWEPIDHAPSADDVYVILDRFEIEGFPYYKMRQDFEVFQAFGVTVPTIYGYRSTDAMPLDPSSIVGIPYTTWRTGAMKSLVEQNVDLVLLYAESCELGHLYMPDYYYARTPILPILRKLFGKTHILTESAKYYLDQHKAFTEIPEDRSRWASTLYENMEGAQSKEISRRASTLTQALKKRYPLLFNRSHALSVFADSDGNPDAWAHYVKCVDIATPFLPQEQKDT